MSPRLDRRPRLLGIALAVAAGLLALAVGAAGNAEAATRSDLAIERAASYLLAQQRANGGFAEPGGQADPSLTAWVVLGLKSTGRAGGTERAALAAAGAYLAQASHRTLTDLELKIMALAAAGQPVGALVRELEGSMLPTGRIGAALNSTFWGMLALRTAGLPVPRRTVRFVIAHQHRSGGFSWIAGGRPDTNDTAAAIQALRGAGVSPRARPIRRAIAYLARQRKRNGGFPLDRARTPDAQSTAWVLQGYQAAGRTEPRRSRRYLIGLQRRAGPVRYKPRLAVSSVWVTAQALPALARRPFPLG